MSLQTYHLSKIYHYQDEQLVLFENLNIIFPEYGMVAILGESGCGKTTLLYILAGLEKDYQGKVLFHHQDIKKVKDYQQYMMSFMYQEDCLYDFLNVYDNCILYNKIKKIAYQKKDVEHLLTMFHLEKEKYKKVRDLSGGQKQRVALIRSLLSQCPIIFCDEPTAALNEKQKKEVYRYLRSYSQKHLIIIVSHDRKVIEYSDHVIDFRCLKHDYDFANSRYQRYSFLFKKRTYSFVKETFSMLYFQKLKIVMIFLSQIFILLSITFLITGLSGFQNYYQDLKENTVNHHLISIQKLNYQPFQEKEIKKLQGHYQYLLDIGKIDQVDYFQAAPFDQQFLENEVIVNQALYKKIKSKTLIYHLNNKTYHLTIKKIIEDHCQEPSLYYAPSSLNDEIKLSTIDVSTCLVYIDDYHQVKKYISQLPYPYEGYSMVEEQFDAYDYLYYLFRYAGMVFIMVSLFVAVVLMFFILLSMFFELQKYDAILISNGMSMKRYYLFIYERIVIICFVIAVMVCLICFGVMKLINVFDISQMIFQISHLFQYPVYFYNEFDLFVIYVTGYLFISILLFLIMIYRMKHINMLDIIKEM